VTQHPAEELCSFALGDLDRPAAEAVLNHADACQSCAALLAEAMTAVAAMTRAGESASVAQPAPAARTPHRASAAPWWVAGLATAAALALAVWNVQLRAATPYVPIAALVHSHFQHHALRGIGGSAKAILALDGSWLYVVADGLKPSADYAVSEKRAGHIVTLGSLRALPDGRAAAFWSQSPGGVNGITISGPNATMLAWP
jgi:hypothetical protein